MNVLIVGASKKTERYSYKAMASLIDKGHKVSLMSPQYSEIEGLGVYNTLNEVDEDIHTVTMYVNAEISTKMQDELIALAPKRIIFNPGSENPNIYNALKDHNIEVEEACTLVLLSTNSFE